MAESNEERIKREEGGKRSHRVLWNKERNNGLLYCFFAGLPVHGEFGLLNVVGTTEKGVSRQFYKIFQRYTDYGERSAPEFDIGLFREGSPWTKLDDWVMAWACTSVGQKHGASTATYIAKCLARSEEEVDKRMDKAVETKNGFGIETKTTTRGERINCGRKARKSKASMDAFIQLAMSYLRAALK